MDNDILTIEEVAKYLRVSVRTVYDWAQKGEIPCGRLGSSWRFRREDVLAWVDTNIPKYAGQKTGRSGSPKLGQIVSPDRCLILENVDKTEALLRLAGTFADTKEVASVDKLTERILRRESLMSTGLSDGVAVPHVRDSSVDDIVVSFAHVRPAIEAYDSLDGKPIEFIAMIAAREGQHEEHISVLSQLSARLKDDSIRNRIQGATTKEHVCAALVL